MVWPFIRFTPYIEKMVWERFVARSTFLNLNAVELNMSATMAKLWVKFSFTSVVARDVVALLASAVPVSVTAAAEVVPVAASAEVVPVAAAAEVVPVAAAAEVVPVAAAAEVVPVAAAAEVVGAAVDVVVVVVGGGLYSSGSTHVPLYLKYPLTHLQSQTALFVVSSK